MNAKEEFIELVKESNSIVTCAGIRLEKYGSTELLFLLKENYTKDDYNSFLNLLDVEYRNGYGCQELFGTVWFADGQWADRGEYDGSEWWELQARPDVPDELKA